MTVASSTKRRRIECDPRTGAHGSTWTGEARAEGHVDFDIYTNAGFAAWEAAWADHLGSKQPEEALNVERPSQPGHNEPADPARKAAHAEAVAFIRDYTGTFGFILDLRARPAWGTKWYRLSDKQVDAVLRVKAREVAPKAKVREETGRDLTAVLPVGRTCAAVTNSEGKTTFLIIDVPADLDRYKQPSKWAGWAFVKQYIGGIGEGQRLGSQRPGETYSGQWATLVDQVLADPKGAVVRFGQELGICGVCQLPLTNEESREYGIGPVCRSKMEG